jgi:hypothetical protein
LPCFFFLQVRYSFFTLSSSPFLSHSSAAHLRVARCASSVAIFMFCVANCALYVAIAHIAVPCALRCASRCALQLRNLRVAICALYVVRCALRVARCNLRVAL